MKAKRITMLWSLPIVAATIALCSAQAQQASTTEWNADPPATPGNWSDATWTTGVPVADSLAGILKGGTVNFPAMGRENRMLSAKRNKNQPNE